MHGEPSSTVDDSALLEEWVLHRREDAFTQIVRQYERLVFGIAIRRTGNAEAARDVAQHVFATLAAKAPLLMGRRNVGGWLYHVASHLGARASRAERRRIEALQSVDPRDAKNTNSDENLWGAVEDAIASLTASEREAIVLHYLQDSSYLEMATSLGITELAARKRVSRALHSLEIRLRTRGCGRSAAAALAALAAQQSLAPAGATAGIVAGAIASSGTASTPLPILISTLMSHTTTKLTACAAAVLFIPLGLQWNANAGLREEISRVSAAQSVQLAAPQSESANRIADLRAELGRIRSAISTAENKTVELAALKRQLETEVVYSMGTVESMARELARASRVSTSIDTTRDALKKAQAADPNSEETKRLHAALKGTTLEAAEMIPRGITLLREMLKIERSPEKAARFYATYLAENGGLDEVTRSKVEARLLPWVADLQKDGLALPQRPKTMDRVQWDERRAATTQTLMQALAAEFPAVNWDQLSLDRQLGGGNNNDWFDMFLSQDDQP